jgi:hypothetical protein
VRWTVFLSLAWLIVWFGPTRLIRLAGVGLLLLIFAVGIG